MNTRRMMTNAILIAIGAILHYITPLLGVPMQPDLSLVMLFIIMIYNRDYKTTVVCGLIVGIFAALTTKTPGGQIPNVLDKFVTCNIVYLILIPIRDRISNSKLILILLPIGTLISGTTFLAALMLLGGIPASSFATLFVAVVLTTVVLNIIAGFMLFKVVERAISVTGAFKSVRG